MGFLIADAPQALSLVNRYLPGSLIAGGAVAGLQHMATMLNEMEKDKKEKTERDDVLTVTIPSPTPKLAAVANRFAQKAIQAGVIRHEAEIARQIAASAAKIPAASISVATPAGVDSVTRQLALAQAKMDAQRIAQKALPPVSSSQRLQNWQNIVSGKTAPVTTPSAAAPAPASIVPGSASSATPAAAPAAASATPTAVAPIAGGAGGGGGSAGGGGSGGAAGNESSKSFSWFRKHPVAYTAAGSVAAGLAGHQALNDEPPPSLMDAGIVAGTIPLGILGGYGLINHFIKKRQKKNLEEQLDQAKSEYSNLLGSSLAKSASDDSHFSFPIIDGICFAAVELDLESESGKHAADINAGMALVGAPYVSGALATIIAHRWMYNKQKEIEALHTTEKPKPPKQIRLVSAPPPDQSEEAPLAIGLQDEEKVAELIHRLTHPPISESKVAIGEGISDIFSFLGGAAPASTEDALQRQLDREKEEREKQPKAIKVAPGVVQITSGEGPIEIEAADPAAARVLSKTSPQLTKLIASFHSTDPSLR